MKKIITTAAITAAFASTASAAVVFSENWDAATLGGVANPFVQTGHASSSFDVVAASPEFGTQHALITGRDNGSYSFPVFEGGTVAGPAYASVTTFKFDFSYDATSFATTGQFRLRARDTGFSGGTTDTARFDLDTGDVTAGTVHTIQYVVNNSTSSADAPDVGGTIAAGSYAIYIDGSIVGTVNSNFTAADGLAVDQLTLWVRGDTGNDVAGQVQIDNFEVHVNPVPEPSSTALLGLGGLALVLRRRR